MEYKTEQELFWASSFGNDYILRNQDLKVLASSMSLFTKILNGTSKVSSFLELGCNIGINLKALKHLNPEAELSGVEINSEAVEELKKWGGAKVYHNSILEYKVDYKRDFVFTRGVLIHINPDYLNLVYELMYESSNKYICIAEYYNPSPVEIDYRGNSEKLFKRDFAGEMMNKYPDLNLVNYGFVYHKDNNFPQDDITWFLLSKN
ncbi:pseudaminic acid biosynthesis-associated methylase [Anaerobacillus alkaliphilus]|uniref:Pseudaminic acid biosynthesis-associated methylase n=1 Tax=Anaerobacillus alkaliphilus TaxID=1548597 RepID=A0A4Q0VUB6_9BACI|nr:pseudaminic acid biosynthesis-associated methylase [Anaerobacillus alkaliphilus]RXJ02277.1 pseudaminic acid biosynthesis-associated methylase [Anaerobacillus alkaliphilus]